MRARARGGADLKPAAAPLALAPPSFTRQAIRRCPAHRPCPCLIAAISSICPPPLLCTAPALSYLSPNRQPNKSVKCKNKELRASAFIRHRHHHRHDLRLRHHHHHHLVHKMAQPASTAMQMHQTQNPLTTSSFLPSPADPQH